MSKSFGFEVSLNGNKIARAGIDKQNYVVNCIIGAVHRKDGSEELNLYVGGMDSDIENYVSWQGGELEVGDKIVIEVIDSNFDQPLNTSRRISKEERIENQLRYFYELKEELKDYL